MSSEAPTFSCSKKPIVGGTTAKAGASTIGSTASSARRSNSTSLPQGRPAVPFARCYDDRAQLRGYFDGLLADWSMQYYTDE